KMQTMSNAPKNASEKKNVLNPVNVCDFNYYNYKITGQGPVGKSIGHRPMKMIR
ncbi:MAG: hypothetical protein ACI88H_002229, partial [Cocleimonas sp.]